MATGIAAQGFLLRLYLWGLRSEKGFVGEENGLENGPSFYVTGAVVAPVFSPGFDESEPAEVLVVARVVVTQHQSDSAAANGFSAAR